MSDNRDSGRTRRRASRTAGPPPAEGVADKSAENVTDKIHSGHAESEAAALAGADSTTEPAGADSITEPAGADSTTEKIHTGSASAGESSRTAETVRVDTPATDAAADDDTVRMGWSVAEPAPGGVGAEAEATVSLKKPGSSESDTASGAAAEAGPGRSWKPILLGAVAALLVVGLVGAAVVSVFAVQSTQHRDERRAEYVATARQTVLNLTTIRADTAKEDIDRILTMASGEFKTEFDGRIDPFTEIVKQAKVESTGEVVEAAVERDDENSGVVLVAAKQSLTNAGTEEEQQRFYRFRVTVTRGDDGQLTASDVEFVA